MTVWGETWTAAVASRPLPHADPCVMALVDVSCFCHIQNTWANRDQMVALCTLAWLLSMCPLQGCCVKCCGRGLEAHGGRAGGDAHHFHACAAPVGRAQAHGIPGGGESPLSAVPQGGAEPGSVSESPLRPQGLCVFKYKHLLIYIALCVP